MLEEVALRNAIVMFRRKTASIPEVGVFWIDNAGLMFAESVSLREAEDYGDFKIFEGSHIDVWEKAIRAVSKWRGLEYEDVPRGRVVYKKDPKSPVFIVYLPKAILKFKNKVISRFSLPVGYTRFDTSDVHYQMAAGEIWMRGG